jgi:hypothetical protein
LTLDRDDCLTSAAEIGSATHQVVQTLLDDSVIDRLPTVGRLLRLRQKFSDERLEAACERALLFGDPAYKTVKRILTQGLENQPVPISVTSPTATAFVRSIEELVGDLVGDEPWN